MDHEQIHKMSAADIKAHGPAEDWTVLSKMLGRLADLALNHNLMLWGWLCAIRDMPDEIAEAHEIPRLETALDALRSEQRRVPALSTSERAAVEIIEAAISVLRRP